MELHGLSWTADFGLPATASFGYAALVRNVFAISSHRQTWRVRQDKDHLMWRILNHSKDWHEDCWSKSLEHIYIYTIYIYMYMYMYIFIKISILYTCSILIYIYILQFACLVFPPPSRRGAMRKRTRDTARIMRVRKSVCCSGSGSNIGKYSCARSLMLKHAVNYNHCQLLSDIMSSVTASQWFTRQFLNRCLAETIPCFLTSVEQDTFQMWGV